MHTICCVYLMNPKVQSLYNDVFFLSVEKETVEKLWKKEAVEFLETGKTQCVYIYSTAVLKKQYSSLQDFIDH